jgi:multisubunit Na+/H+ antiporter MnhB subunit
MTLTLQIGLAVLVLAVATWSVCVRETFAAVIGFVAYGLLLTLVWVSLSAADVALTEAAIGGGLTGLLLLGASARLRATDVPMSVQRSGKLGRFVAAVCCASLSVGLAFIVLTLPNPAPTLAPEAAANLPKTGLGNPVSAVLIVYRSLDTLLEKVVLLLALIGVWSLARDSAWGGQPGPRHRADADGVIVFFAQLLTPIGILVGIHIVWVGANAPGGAFQGGAILAAMWIITMLAGVADAPAISRPWLRLALVAGPAVFLIVGTAGFGLAGAFLAFPVGYAKPLILTIEAGLTLSIAATLGLLVAGPPERPQNK